jgi:hypothetical protein
MRRGDMVEDVEDARVAQHRADRVSRVREPRVAPFPPLSHDNRRSQNLQAADTASIAHRVSPSTSAEFPPGLGAIAIARPRNVLFKYFTRVLFLGFAGAVLVGNAMASEASKSSGSIDEQRRCADAAQHFFAETQTGPADTAFRKYYNNHLNIRLNKCFILVYAYDPKDDNIIIDLYDALEHKRYATFIGRNSCDPVSLKLRNDPDHCWLNSGHIWLDGNDQGQPDMQFGFEGILNGPRTGGQNTKTEFLRALQPLMSE